MLSNQLLVKGVALAFVATATAVWTGKDMGTAGSESCEFIPLNGGKTPLFPASTITINH
jgi:hypothetical protein